MNVQIFEVIQNSGITLSNFTESGKSVLASAVLSKTPLINIGYEAIKVNEQQRLRLKVDNNSTLLEILSATNTSNYYTHLRIINDLVFEDINLDDNIQMKIKNFVLGINLKNNLDSKAVKWLQSKQNFELNVIGKYELFIGAKNQEVYISTIDKEDIINELFESNIKEGMSYDDGPRKYKKLSELGLHIMINLFNDEKIKIELENAIKEVEYLVSLKINRIEPRYYSKNLHFYNNTEIDDKYIPLNNLDKEYIKFYKQQDSVISIKLIGKTWNSAQINLLHRHIYRDNEVKISYDNNLEGKKINISDIAKGSNCTYYFERSFIESGYNEENTEFSWENFLKS